MEKRHINRIRELREARGISGYKLAEELGISPQHLYELERGVRRLNEDTIEKLVKFFGVSADYLLALSDAIMGRPLSAVGKRYPAQIIGERVARMMEIRGLTPAQVAIRAGVVEDDVRKAMEGKLKDPELGFVRALARVLKVPIDYLAAEEVVTPLEVLDNLPPEMVEWLLREDVIPFLEVAKKAQERGLTPEALEKLHEFLEALRENRDGGQG